MDIQETDDKVNVLKAINKVITNSSSAEALISSLRFLRNEIDVYIIVAEKMLTAENIKEIKALEGKGI